VYFGRNVQLHEGGDRGANFGKDVKVEQINGSRVTCGPFKDISPDLPAQLTVKRKEVELTEINRVLAEYVREHSLADAKRLRDPAALQDMKEFCISSLEKGTAGMFVYAALNYLVVPEADMTKGCGMVNSMYRKILQAYRLEYEMYLAEKAQEGIFKVSNDLYRHFGVLGEVYEIMLARGERVRGGDFFSYELAREFSEAREASPNKRCIYDGPSEVTAVDSLIQNALNGKGMV